VKTFLVALFCFSVVLAQHPQQKASATIARGTPVQIALSAPVRSDEVKEGSQIAFNVVEPVRTNGITVIDRGAIAIARVEKAKKAGAWGKGGQLIWTIDGVTATDGTRVPLAFTSTAKGDNARGTMLTGVAVTSFLLGPLGLLWGFKKGKQATIPAGQIFQVAVADETVISGILVADQPSAESPSSIAGKQQPTPIPGRKCIEKGYRVPCP